ncbi:MAG: SDR family oxidoreductase [Stenomitos rutilans HA7619-LM2]|jgi:short-subunit dehydrogenase|nr:SDR family oxidoreductase [Stenomitos rutilans HA7619-LM2]
MTKTILITGASTGIGYETARLFQQRGWNVVATMRSPEKAEALAALENVCCLRVDVTDPESISQAIRQTLERFQSIDILLNNAGYGLVGAFEACSLEQIERQFATNVFGLMAMTRALLPHFREQRSGIIMNVSSIGGQMGFPLYSLYHATKWAVEGFSESLQYELEAFNIRVKIIEPGPIKTDFYERSAELASKPGLTAYDAFVAKVMTATRKADATGSPPAVTAQVIYRAATDGSRRLRYPAGGNAGALIFLRKLLPDRLFSGIIRGAMMR